MDRQVKGILGAKLGMTQVWDNGKVVPVTVVQAGPCVVTQVRTPDKDLYQVRPGNHLGQNYGVILGVTDGEIKLKELIQDGAGDWTERSSTLQLLQPQERK